MKQSEFRAALNTAFLFIPMDLAKPEERSGSAREMSCEEFRRLLEESGQWLLADERENNRYIYRYITDKMNPEKKEECLYLRYHLSDEACRMRGWGPDGAVFHIQQEREIRFSIRSVSLFTFRTVVNIAAVQITFAEDEPGYIAEGLYYLKKVQRAQLAGIGQDAGKSAGNDAETGVNEAPRAKAETADKAEKMVNPEPETLLEAIRGLFVPALQEKLRFFPYLNEGTERANTMSLACEPEGGNWKKDLYFLKNGYRANGFSYREEMDTEDETLFTSDDYVWGITGENLACLILKKTDHVKQRFAQRFQEEYLLTYIILLHRKFDLYKILTDFGIGEQNDLQTLKAYQKQLNSYQTDYAYERITEVPQYHRLYKRIEEKMELAELFADVMEPVSELSSLRMEKAEEDRGKQERKMEWVLAILSILTVFSALIDCVDYLGVVAGNWPIWFHITWKEQTLPRIQLVFSIGIVLIAAWALVGIFWRKRQKH